MLCRYLEGNSYEDQEVTTWFTEALGSLHSRKKRTKRISIEISKRSISSRQSDNSVRELSFANEDQLLLVSKASVEELNRRVAALHAG